MPFPTTLILDNFNRADSGPPPSASWTTDPIGYGAAGHKVLSNVMAPNGATDNDSRYTAVQFTGDVEGYLTISTKPANNGEEISLLFVSSGNSSPTQNGYQISCTVAAGTDTIVVQRFDAGVFTTLATYNQEFASGDKVGVSKIGSTITTYYNNGTSWVSLGTVTDNTYSTGYLGIYNSGSTARIDDFGGGNVKKGVMTTNTGFWGGL